MTNADTNITELRPTPQKGEGPNDLRRRHVKDRTATERKRRSRARKRNHRDNPAGHAVTVPPVTLPPMETVTSHAVTPAGCAAWFSIRGMTVLFPGTPIGVVAMAIAMETAKLITAGWLARRWQATAAVWRLVLVMLVLGLAVINASGVYAQLVSAHVRERGAAQAHLETQAADLDARIQVIVYKVADLDARVSQIDAAIAEATRRGRTTGAMSIMEGQKKARAGLVDERNREAGTLAAVKAERASLAAKGRQVETEAVPIRTSRSLSAPTPTPSGPSGG
jgi:hypothetical protein